jgi:hypothetical protein
MPQPQDTQAALLLPTYQGLQQRAATIPAEDKVRLTDALARLVQLDEAWGQQAEAARWRHELEVAKAANPPVNP